MSDSSNGLAPTPAPDGPTMIRVNLGAAVIVFGLTQSAS